MKYLRALIESLPFLGRVPDQPFVTTLHLHPKTDEYLLVLEGVLSFYISDRWHDLAAGSLAIVPHGTPHAQRNRSAHSVRVLGAGNPAGFELFFMAQDQLLQRPSTPEYFSEIAKLFPQYDTVVLGPPPP
jgi:uncharacterized cupin superfamily protein